LQSREASSVARNLSRRTLVALVLTFVRWVNVVKFEFDTRFRDELLAKIHAALPFFTFMFAASVKVSLSDLNYLFKVRTSLK
jgi:hypothetical protein